MGSSNGSTRGQLRPYLSGRSPPFLLVGLLVVMGILGFSYWSLNTQYNDLQTEIQKLQDRLRLYAEKRESVEKMNNALQAQMQTYKEENKKYRITVDKRDQEINTIAEQLRNREEDVVKASSHIESLKTDMEKLETRDKQKELEISSLQDQAKSLKVENQELADLKAQISGQLDTLKAQLEDLKKNAPVPVDVNKLSVKDTAPDDKTREVSSLNPNEGMPPQNRDMNNISPFQFIPPPNGAAKPASQEDVKGQTMVPESPDVSNIEKLSEATSRNQLGEVVNSVNDIEPQPQAVLHNPGGQ